MVSIKMRESCFPRLRIMENGSLCAMPYAVGTMWLMLGQAVGIFNGQMVRQGSRG